MDSILVYNELIILILGEPGYPGTKGDKGDRGYPGKQQNIFKLILNNTNE